MGVFKVGRVDRLGLLGVGRVDRLGLVSGQRFRQAIAEEVCPAYRTCRGPASGTCSVAVSKIPVQRFGRTVAETDRPARRTCRGPG